MFIDEVTQLGTADYPPGAVFRRAVLNDWELVWVLSGSARWDRAQQLIVMNPGDVLLIGPGPADQFCWDERQSTRHGYVHFRPSVHEPALGADVAAVVSEDSQLPAAEAVTSTVGRPTLVAGEPARVWTLTGSDLPAALCRHLVDLAAWPDSRAQERAREVVGLLITVLLAGPLPGRAITALPLPIDDAARHVGRVWATRGVSLVELAELARSVSLSRRHLCRLFAIHLGIGPVKAFELVRLGRVAAMLARSNLTLAAIAAASGYASPFHLSRHFSAECGISPRNYRRRSAAGMTLVDPVMSRGLQALSYVVGEAEHPPITTAFAHPSRVTTPADR